MDMTDNIVTNINGMHNNNHNNLSTTACNTANFSALDHKFSCKKSKKYLVAYVCNWRQMQESVVAVTRSGLFTTEVKWKVKVTRGQNETKKSPFSF